MIATPLPLKERLTEPAAEKPAAIRANRPLFQRALAESTRDEKPHAKKHKSSRH